ncbi:hypothetical protein GUITHDRAFT_109343 [Guillardia theta CCMP2712]|uniref:Serine/threonine-protein phosphatase n=1 Tax=Guillardia theta (strain CCMP2712) TaxID=905079 RepID=L1J9D7_GUITC|nr:hypothetical protein GUITHDRAFT_109343 [Guillardia theta CCMP2712]EKX44927.1 hypothetical protein GUITHDRAFT_109343 [Guillardia theta CCMP2712]|eukprot:XP_005831907.1 hypothetical protein GUITHDRAFT_109343 [Guillardia theta CCMP2712]
MSLEGQLNQFVMNHFSSMRLLDPESSSKGADVEIHQRYMSPRKSEENALHPKALFLETKKDPDFFFTPSPPNSTSKESPRGWSDEYFNMTLSEAVTRGDYGYVERVALQMLSMARTRDAAKLQDLITAQFAGPAPLSSSSTMSSASTILSSSRFSDIYLPGHSKQVSYSPHILSVKKAIGCTDFSSELIPNNLPGTFLYDTPARQVPNVLAPVGSPMSYACRRLHHLSDRAQKDAIINVVYHAKNITAKENRLLDIPSPCYVLGDVHGNLHDLNFFIKMLWPAGLAASAGNFLFLGDFVDRGMDSVVVVAYVMAMKILFPAKWWLIRGNHETREVNGNTDHYREGSFLKQCIKIFGEVDGHLVWESVNNFFDTLPLAATIDSSIFCVHGGIPKSLCEDGATLDIINEVECPLRAPHANQMVYDMLWSDPSSPDQALHELDEAGFGQSSRGCASFSDRSIDIFLSKYEYNFQHIFRGHEAQKSGVGVNRNARLTTIFSTSKDHFQDNSATCGCVLVESGVIQPVIRSNNDLLTSTQITEMHVFRDPQLSRAHNQPPPTILAQPMLYKSVQEPVRSQHIVSTPDGRSWLIRHAA